MEIKWNFFYPNNLNLEFQPVGQGPLGASENFQVGHTKSDTGALTFIST